MEKILFEENLTTDRRYKKEVILSAIAEWLACACFLAMVILGIAFDLADSEIRWMCILPFLFAIWTGYMGIAFLCSRRQYIRIYADRIVYRKPFQKNEQVILLSPPDYKIRLYRSMNISGSYPTKYPIEFVILDADGNTLLSYISPTLYASHYQSPRYKWEDDLLSLGCEIIDYEKIIVNK